MMNTQNIAKWLVVLVVFLQIGLPALNYNEYADITATEVTIDQVYGAIDSHNSEWIVTDKSDIFSNRVDLGSTLFYTLSHFTLDLFYSGLIKLKWLLTHLVNIYFTKSDIIFPFAYFW
jgi:hypothetical protein